MLQGIGEEEMMVTIVWFRRTKDSLFSIILHQVVVVVVVPMLAIKVNIH